MYKYDEKVKGTPITSKGGFVIGRKISYWGGTATMTAFEGIYVKLEFDVGPTGKMGVDGWYRQDSLLNDKHIFYVGAKL